MRRGSVRIAGATLNYVVEGEGGPVLLVLGSSIYYPRTFSLELRKACTLICLDLPHFAPVDARFDPACISFDLYSECIEAVRADAGLGRVGVVGHSHHGNIALEYARRKPRNVSNIVLIGTPPANVEATVKSAEQYWQDHATLERKEVLRIRRASTAIGAEESRSACETYIRQYVTDAPLYWHDPNYDAAWLWKGMSFSMDAVHAFRNLYRSYVLHWDATLRDLPILVVMGVDDFAVPPTMWSAVLPGLSHVTFCQLERSGHTPQLEQASEFDRYVLTWLSGSLRANRPS